MSALDDRMTEEFLTHLLDEETKDYVARGRRFKATEMRDLAEMWVAAFRAVFIDDQSDRIPDMDDLTIEMSLRQVDPPVEKVAAEFVRIVEQFGETSPQVLDAIENFMEERNKSILAV